MKDFNNFLNDQKAYEVMFFNTCKTIHCVKSVQIRSYFWSVFSTNTRKYGPEKTPYLDTFHAVINILRVHSILDTFS